jgi:hypothetical protein
MTDYQIQPNTRRCSITGRELRPGERVYSVLLEEAGRFTRRDYGAEVWNGPPDDAFSFWAGRVIAPDTRKRPPIDDEMLFDCFSRLEDQLEESRVRFRYVLALLLMRRKRLRLDSTRTEDGREVLMFRDVRTVARFAVVNPQLSDVELESVQDEVFQAIGW